MEFSQPKGIYQQIAEQMRDRILAGEWQEGERIPSVRELAAGNARVDVADPWADAAHARDELGLTLVEAPEPGAYDAVVLAVAHDVFREPQWSARRFATPAGVVFDVKGMLPDGEADARV